MCGRYGLATTVEAIEAAFGVPAFNPRLAPPRYNIAPTQPIPVIRPSAEGGRELVPVRWGLIPSWTKKPGEMPLLINARAEGIADKPSFRNAFRRRRCLVPASGFYEWQATGSRSKQPYWISPTGGGLMALAGIWETLAGADGDIDTAAIVTTEANERLKDIHSRSPVVIERQDYEAWLSPGLPAEAAEALLAPPAEDSLEAVPVSTRVNSIANDDPGLLMPVA